MLKHIVEAGAAIATLGGAVYGYKRFKGAPAPPVKPALPATPSAPSTPSGPSAPTVLTSSAADTIAQLGPLDPTTLSQGQASSLGAAIDALGGFGASDLGQAQGAPQTTDSSVGTPGDVGDTSTDDGSGSDDITAAIDALGF